MESAELQAMHNSKKQMDTLMGRHDLPSEIKAQEIGKDQDLYLLFRNRLKLDKSVKGKGTGTKEYILTRVNHLCS